MRILSRDQSQSGRIDFIKKRSTGIYCFGKIESILPQYARIVLEKTVS